jgi:acyl dehydratase
MHQLPPHILLSQPPNHESIVEQLNFSRKRATEYPVFILSILNHKEAIMARGLYFSEYNVGDSFTTIRRTITETDVVMFAGLSGDFNPLHTDAVFAESTPFGQRIAHGMLVASISTGLSQTLGIFEETTIGLLQQSFKYTAPTFFGDTIHLKMTVANVKPSSKGGKGVVTFDTEIIKQDGTVVNQGQWVVMFRDKK